LHPEKKEDLPTTPSAPTTPISKPVKELKDLPIYNLSDWMPGKSL